jgi:hypothetical protein
MRLDVHELAVQKSSTLVHPVGQKETLLYFYVILNYYWFLPVVLAASCLDHFGPYHLTLPLYYS